MAVKYKAVFSSGRVLERKSASHAAQVYQVAWIYEWEEAGKGLVYAGGFSSAAHLAQKEVEKWAKHIGKHGIPGKGEIAQVEAVLVQKRIKKEGVQ